MDIVQIVAIGLITAILSLSVKKYNAEMSVLIAVVGGIIIFLLVIPKIGAVLEVLKRLGNLINIESEYLVIMLKVIGIAYIAEFGIQVCKDAGEGVIASKIELAGKVLIMVISLPIIVSVIESITTII